MSDHTTSRRDLIRIAAACVATAAAIATTAGQAHAYQGNMERALSALQEALAALHEATPNKGGHKARAAALVEQAIAETQAGIDYANEHGGG